MAQEEPHEEHSGLAALQRIEHVWATRYPRHAAGGRWALAGFRYQLIASLLEILRAWRDEEPLAAGPGAFLERLSDIVRVARDQIVITQVKRRQTSRGVQDALQQLWSVYEVALDVAPGVAPRLSFRILSAERQFTDVTHAFDAWAPEGASDISDISDTTVAGFKAQVEIVVDSRPEYELLAVLHNNFKAAEPRQILERWLGQLLDAAESDELLRAAALDIWNDIATLAGELSKPQPSGFLLWTSADRAPDEIHEGKYLTGQQPRLYHLREGFFAPRERLIRDLSAAVGEWSAQHPDPDDHSLRVPVFWIGGRSGSGKSVALLQVVARLHLSGGSGPILWLANNFPQLPAAAQWTRRYGDTDDPVVVAIDDPYLPAAQEGAADTWRAFLAELEDMRQLGDRSRIPLVVCCGPTEQAQRLVEDFPDDLDVQIHPLPLEERADIEELRSWYGTRTGQAPPDVGEENVLLVQLFFEWAVGQTLPQFADRFRRRLRAADLAHRERTTSLEEFVARLLALNRLYVGLPETSEERLLSPAQRDVFAHLRTEHHVQAGTENRGGLWLAHPHLSNVIFNSWFPAHKAHERIHHLNLAIEACELWGSSPSEQTAPLWALARGLRGSRPQLEDRIDPLTATLLPARYQAAISRSAGRQVPLTHAPVWIELACVVSELRLEPDPIAAAIARLPSEPLAEPGFRLTCHQLLQHLADFGDEQRTATADSLRAVLARDLFWAEWEAVARDAVVRTEDRELIPLVLEWLRAHTSLEGGQLLLAALRTWPEQPDLLAAARPVLTQAPPTFVWADVAQWLAAHDWPDSSATVLEWVGALHSELGLVHALGSLIRTHGEVPGDWGLDWLRRWRHDPRANYVLEPLLERGAITGQLQSWSIEWVDLGSGDAGRLVEQLVRVGTDPTIPAAALAWLRRQPHEHGSWAFVWQALWERDPDNPELAVLARHWLHTSTEHDSWAFVWQALWGRDPGDPELPVLGRHWLDSTTPEHGSWAFVWQALWGRDPDNPELPALGRHWLDSTSPEHGSWSFVWQALWEHDPGNPELAALGRHWLDSTAPDHGSWSFVWRDLWGHDPGSPELTVLARHWLDSTSPAHGSWSFVWRDLWEQDPENRELAVLARHWLDTTPEHGSWAFVWQALWGHDPDNPELMALGRHWLETTSRAHGSWAFVLRALLDRDPGDAALAALGRQWLESTSPDHGSWAPVLRSLLEYDPGNAALAARGRQWLDSNPPEHRSWAVVLQAVLKNDPGDAELAALARHWLDTTPEHRSWQYVWDTLWKRTPGDPELVALARRWLNATTEHHSWSFVLRSLLEHDPDDPELGALGRQWLDATTPKHRSWALVLQAVLRQDPDDPQLSALARQWLETAAPEHRSWQYVWDALWKRTPGDPELATLGRHWLDSTTAHHSWAFVWGALWKQAPRDPWLAALGRQWLDATTPRHGSWSFVLRGLLDRDPANPELGALGRRWLDATAPEHRSWALVLQAVLKQDPDDPELTALARQWLETAAPEHRSWQYVWDTLWKRTPGDPELATLGRHWLDTGTTHHSWAFVWDALWKRAPGDPELAALGRHWLDVTTAKHGSWSFVLRALLEHDPGNPELAELAALAGGRFRPSA